MNFINRLAQSYQKIENLDEFTGLKCLWLECNAISEICGLENQKELRCLYLHNNFIRKMENLQHCAQLDTLNLSHNYVKSIENCNSLILPQLNTLNLSHNSLSCIDGLEELAECKTLSVLDISHNRIEDVLIVKILSQMPELRVLTLTGNPVINEIPSYRKTLTVECKNLTYLDSRPIFDKDRACAEAWKRGGYEEEKREKLKWEANQQKKIMDSVRATLRFRQKLQEKNASSDANSAALIGDNEQSEISNSQPKIEEIIERVEKSIELYSYDEPPDFNNFETILDSMAPNVTDTANQTVASEKVDDNSTEAEIANHTHTNEATSAPDGCEKINRISTESLESSPEAKTSVDMSRIECSDVESMNILNICMNSTDELRTKIQASILHGKSKPVIEVLSDSESTELSVDVLMDNNSEKIVKIEEVNALNGFNTKDTTTFAADDATVEETTITTDSHDNDQLSPDDSNNETVEMNKTFYSTSKSSAITFFCENLDDLKGIDSDSDQILEEI